MSGRNYMIEAKFSLFSRRQFSCFVFASTSCGSRTRFPLFSPSLWHISSCISEVRSQQGSPMSFAEWNPGASFRGEEVGASPNQPFSTMFLMNKDFGNSLFDITKIFRPYARINRKCANTMQHIGEGLIRNKQFALSIVQKALRWPLQYENF